MMTNRANRTTFSGVVMTMLAAVCAGSAYADETKNVDMEFAGVLLLNLIQQQFDTAGMPTVTAVTGISQARAVGTLGKADVRVATQAGPPTSAQGCPDGFMPVASIIENNIVFTFRDLSMLYGNGQGVVCLSMTDFMTQVASVDGVWMGGTKRFANAAGEFAISIDNIVPISPSTQFSAESGHITGFLTRPVPDD